MTSMNKDAYSFRKYFNAPLVLVKNKDGTNRFCIDFRKLNAITKFHPEPKENRENLMASMNEVILFSKVFLCTTCTRTEESKERWNKMSMHRFLEIECSNQIRSGTAWKYFESYDLDG